MKKTKFLWITDPWNTLDHPKDTTLRLAQESLALGHENFWCDVRSIRLDGGRVLCDTARIRSIGNERSSDSFVMDTARGSEPKKFDSLQYRVDPPVDLAYQHPLALLRISLHGEKRAKLVNPLSALLLANEKMEAALLPKLMPTSVVSSQWEPLRAFGVKEGKTVLKPLELAQSKGIELLSWKTPAEVSRSCELITAATQNFSRPVLLQRYLPEIAQGETRLWFLNSKLLATAKKLPLENDFRVDIDRGSRLAAHRLSAREKKAALEIGKRLKALNVSLAAVDLIGGYVTDFNLTSPGLITQMEDVTGENLARKIVQGLVVKSR